MKYIILGFIILYSSCNTTSKEAGARQGADLLARNCFELSETDCYRAPQCDYDTISYTCMNRNNRPGNFGYQSNCSFYSSEYDCPRSTCRWTGYSCVDFNNGMGTQQNNQCQFYNNDPSGCQRMGCLYMNGICQMNPNQPFQGQNQGVNCFNVFNPSQCAVTPGCQWLGNQCQNRY